MCAGGGNQRGWGREEPSPARCVLPLGDRLRFPAPDLAPGLGPLNLRSLPNRWMEPAGMKVDRARGDLGPKSCSEGTKI